MANAVAEVYKFSKSFYQVLKFRVFPMELNHRAKNQIAFMDPLD
jgi:hypothetical protein